MNESKDFMNSASVGKLCGARHLGHNNLVPLRWVPSHQRIEENEKADKLSKEA